MSGIIHGLLEALYPTPRPAISGKPHGPANPPGHGPERGRRRPWKDQAKSRGGGAGGTLSRSTACGEGGEPRAPASSGSQAKRLMGAKRAGSTEKATSGSSRPQRFMLQSDFFSWGAALRWQAGPSGSGSSWPCPCASRLHISGQVQPRPCIGHILTGSSVMAVSPGANGLSSSSAARTPANGTRSHAEENSTNGIIPLCEAAVTKGSRDGRCCPSSGVSKFRSSYPGRPWRGLWRSPPGRLSDSSSEGNPAASTWGSRRQAWAPALRIVRRYQESPSRLPTLYAGDS
jgi:hypothetical protein